MPKPLLIALIAVAAVYILCVLAPSVSMFLAAFGRMHPLAYAKKDFTGTYIEPYTEEFRASIAFFENKTPEEWHLKARDGVPLVGDYYGQNSGRLAILMHGFNASPYNNLVAPARDLYEAGYDLLFLYQRAHLKSGGHKNGMGLIERYDLLDWIDLAAKRDDVDSIIVWGVSMGGTTVAYASGLIREPKVKALTIDCGFVSPHRQLQLEAKKNHIPVGIVLPRITFFAKVFRGLDLHEAVTESLKGDSLPTLFLHGGQDTVVLPENGRENFGDCASSNKKMYFKEEAGHGMAYPALSREERKEILTFLTQAESL